jgi:hypothetical protein
MLGGINIAGLCCCPATIGSIIFEVAFCFREPTFSPDFFDTSPIYQYVLQYLRNISQKFKCRKISVLFQKTFQTIVECTRNFSTIAWWDS